MLKRILIITLLSSFIANHVSGQDHMYRRRGVIFGGLAGAAIGAAIGDKGDNETTGALIGGAVGAIAGGTIGNQKDQQVQHYRHYHTGHSQYGYPQGHYAPGAYQAPQQSYYAPRVVPQSPVPARPIAPASRNTSAQVTVHPISPQDVVAMVRSGLSEPLIIQQIEFNGALHPLSVSDVIQLHQAGVSEPIINAMQAAAPVDREASVKLEGPASTKSAREELPMPPSPFGPSILKKKP
jgi:hypothetical protein